VSQVRFFAVAPFFYHAADTLYILPRKKICSGQFFGNSCLWEVNYWIAQAPLPLWFKPLGFSGDGDS